MLRRFDESIQTLASIIASKSERLCDKLDRRIMDEDDFTSRLLQSIEDAADDLVLDGVRWTVETRKLPWRGKDSEESRYGADFGLVIQMKGKGLNIAKGYLVQAKREISGFPTHPADRVASKLDRRLLGQASKMLNITPESYAWFYTKNGIFILRAGMLVGSNNLMINEFRFQGIHGFFVRALMSWSGDYRLGEMAAKNLGGFMEEFQLKQAILIGGQEVRDRA